jgi:hypothetical protein
MEASRQRATKRKMKILSHTWVGCKVMPLFFLYMKSFSGIRIDSCISVLYSIIFFIIQYCWVS